MHSELSLMQRLQIFLPSLFYLFGHFLFLSLSDTHIMLVIHIPFLMILNLVERNGRKSLFSFHQGIEDFLMLLLNHILHKLLLFLLK